MVHSLTLFPRIFHYHGDKKYSFLGGIGLLVNIWVVKSPYLIFFHYFDLLVAQIQKWELFVPLSIFCLYRLVLHIWILDQHLEISVRGNSILVISQDKEFVAFKKAGRSVIKK